jgi:integrase
MGEETEKVLAVCPDMQWRLLFALSRYAGLRCPSEHRVPKWSDVDWEKNRIGVQSRKTEHHPGGESRWVPLFPELQDRLETVAEAIPKPACHPRNGTSRTVARARGMCVDREFADGRAKAHFLQVTEEHFQQAAQKAAQQPAELARNESQTDSGTNKETPVLQGFATQCEVVPFCTVGDTGLEPVTPAL